MAHGSSYTRVHVALAWLLLMTVDSLLLVTDAATAIAHAVRNIWAGRAL